jgi:hypothetical protein
MQMLLQERRSLQGQLKKIEADVQTLESGFAGHEWIEVAPDDEQVRSKLKELENQKGALLLRQKAVEREISLHEHRLSRLQYWLGLEAIGGVSILILAKGSFYFSAMLGSFFGAVPFIYWYALLILAALIFAPYMIRTLIRTEKWNWVVVFAVMVIVPCFLLLIPSESPVLTLVFQLFPLLMFYIYCGLLRWAVDSWLD